ncbi:MAG: DNA-directed RNA polymerase subunit beta' [Chloroflexi bacterium RBG_16_56_11]|nr:MAG: DNA-directed RNA polymerase subunit beta' [Chloroflexi bacterium RBG_16_56_11]
MFEINDFDAVRISLASPEQIRSWSYGEVTKPETINYRTLKPERDGLFCERIFGPTKDFECYCGKYKRIRYKGVICDKCGVEVARAKVRRERMGHIELACPVSHIWFAKGIPSRLGLLLDLSPRALEHVLYFSQYIVTSIDEESRQAALKRLEEDAAKTIGDSQKASEDKIAAMEQEEATVEEVNKARGQTVDEKDKIEEGLALDVEKLKDLHVKELLTENQFHDLKQRFGDVFEAGMGAEAILQIMKGINLDEIRNNLLLETQSSSGQRRKKASKQLRVVEAFRNSGNKPDWMVLTVLPVLPPDLRPMVQLDGGRFATSDLNDLYRRVINRNNRLRHLIDIGAPEIIIRNEKRMLQEAVDSLIDNGRRGRAISISGNHKLKSLSDMLRGKQGRFRQNLLGKRVDYSGRSVIVCGPELKLHQCGLPRRMALELFKPFVMRRLVAQGLAPNIKSARRLVERAKSEVYDILEEVIKERPVLLNRAPTLHRLSIQAFEPVLIDGSAIQIHPLVCSAFNADFDGDQMAVHVPLSRAAVKEARDMMLSHHNILLPSSGEPTMAPTLDMVLGCYYLTTIRHRGKENGRLFGSFEEARLAYEFGVIDLREEIEVRDTAKGERFKTSVGRIIFNEVLPAELGFYNKVIDKGTLKQIATKCSKILRDEDTGEVLDNIKRLGFQYASKSGITIAMNDIEVPANKPKMLEEAEARIATIENQYHRGLITDEERYNGVVGVWMETTDNITNTISNNLDRYGGVYMMANSGAKGNISQIRQMAGMRGLMTDPSGKIIEFPIKSSLREGHSILEYFISTHGARKGLADTALRTSDSGYLTRRLIDVAQDVITADEDCGTTDGVWITEPKEKGLLPPLAERALGRTAVSDIVHPETDEVIVARNEEISEQKVEKIAAAGLTTIQVRSPLTCQSRRGTCRLCYGRDLAHGKLIEPLVAVGIIAAESIGEPGTQLTLRTFHTGGVVGLDITSGLPRVEELFEARTPRGQAIISEIDGTAEIVQDEGGRRIKVASTETYHDEYPLPAHWQVMVKNGQMVDIGMVLAAPAPPGAKEKEKAPTDVQPVVARFSGEVSVKKKQLIVSYAEKEEREYVVPSTASIWIQNGDAIKAGQQLTDGSVNPHDILRILGKEAVQQYLVDEVQKVYRSQGVNINDKHIEVIAHQMLTKVRIDSAGDTDLVPDELIDKYAYEDTNAKVLAEGGEPATAHTVLLGITRASLSTDSWLAAASFQETTRILTEAAANGRIDKLVGLKENVIIGKLIPARYLTDEKMAELLPPKAPEQDEAQRLLASLAISEVEPVGTATAPAGEEKEENLLEQLGPGEQVAEPPEAATSGEKQDE